MIRLRTPVDAPVLEIAVSGEITRAEIEQAFADIEAALAHRDQIKVLEEIGPLDGVEPMALWRDLQLGLPLMKRFSHAAVVTDTRWIAALTNLTSTLLPTKVRVFASDQLDDARAWLLAA